MDIFDIIMKSNKGIVKKKGVRKLLSSTKKGGGGDILAV